MSLKKIFPLFLLTFFICFAVQARIKLEVVFAHKLGIDNSMVLESELHSIEEMFESESVELTMQEGLSLNLSADFVQREKDYGPSPFIRVEGIIYDSSGNQIKRLDSEETIFRIGETKTLSQSTEEGRKIELTITPTVY